MAAIIYILDITIDIIDMITDTIADIIYDIIDEMNYAIDASIKHH